jgi:hypothetical protein
VSQKANFLSEKSIDIFWEVTWKFTNISKESIASSEGQGVNSTLLASCTLFGMCFMATLWSHSRRWSMLREPQINFPGSPAREKDPTAATRPAYDFCLFFFTSTVNRVLVGMIFLGNDNIQSFILKQMMSVNLKAVTSKFKITFHIFRE